MQTSVIQPFLKKGYENETDETVKSEVLMLSLLLCTCVAVRYSVFNSFFLLILVKIVLGNILKNSMF